MDEVSKFPIKKKTIPKNHFWFWDWIAKEWILFSIEEKIYIPVHIQ